MCVGGGGNSQEVRISSVNTVGLQRSGMVSLLTRSYLGTQRILMHFARVLVVCLILAFFQEPVNDEYQDGSVLGFLKSFSVPQFPHLQREAMVLQSLCLMKGGQLMKRKTFLHSRPWDGVGIANHSSWPSPRVSGGYRVGTSWCTE